jgi:WD40 repeat protein/mono/diheme cytochrome c family protein
MRLSRAILTLALLSLTAVASAEPAAVSYHRQVRPIFQRRCQGCHQPANRSGKLVLSTFEGMRKGGDHGAALKPARPEESLIVQYIAGPEPKMPKGGPPLPPAEVELIRRWIAQGARDDSPAVKDPIDAQHPPVYRTPPVISALAYSPDGETLAVSGYREVLLHKSDGSGLVGRLVGQSHRIESILYASDGKMLAAVGGKPAEFGEVQFWDPAARRLVKSVTITYDTLYGASLSPDGRRLAFGCADNSARIITVPDGNQVLKFDNHNDWVFGTTFSQEGKHLITASRDTAMKLVEADTGSFVDDINKHYAGIRCLARNPKADQALIGGQDGIPRLYLIFRVTKRTMMDEDHNLIRAFERQPGPITALAWSPDGKQIAVGSEGSEVRVYNVADGTRIATLKGLNGATFAMAFHPNGKQIATGGFDGQIRLFDAATGRLIKAFVPVPLQAQVATVR